MNKLSFPAPLLRAAGFLLLFLTALLFSQRNYLVFHTGIEFLSVIVAWSIFGIAVNTHRYSRNSYFMFLGLAYVFIGSIDLLHAMAYKGMNIFLTADTSNLATQLWIAARWMEGTAISASAIYLSRTIKVRRTVLLFSTVFILILLSIFQWQNFPLCFSDSMTAFKIISEYIVSGLFLAGIICVFKHKDRFLNKEIFHKIIFSYAVSIAAELLFTAYKDIYGTFNMAGHYLKLVSYFYFYEALVKTNLHFPHQQLQIVNERLSMEIAGREEVEAKRLRYEQELNKLSKLESITTLAGGLAHDFKNLLTIILGNASLAEVYTRDERIRKNLKHIACAAIQGAELANRLLTFTKDGEPLKEPVDLKELVRETAQMALSGTKVRAAFSGPDTPQMAEVDTAQICQVVNNIVINAVQAMPWGGFLVIDLHKARVDPETDNLPIAPGKYVVISFKDQGVGITEENLDQVFVPFFTTKKDGSGMGLATCFTIINKHRGYITVASERGLGTTFTVYLPACSSTTAARLETAAAGSQEEPK